MTAHTSAGNAAPHLAFVNPDGLYDPRPNGYSHAVVARAPGPIVYLAGQGGQDLQGRVSADFRAQVRQALVNVRIALEAVDARMADVVRLKALVVDHTEQRLRILVDEIHACWGDLPAPACTLIPVPRLALDGMLFEVEATALLAAP